MTYNLKFHKKALKEWNKLDKSIRENDKIYKLLQSRFDESNDI